MRRSGLNKTYRQVWNVVNNTWVAMFGTARAKDKDGPSRAEDREIFE